MGIFVNEKKPKGYDIWTHHLQSGKILLPPEVLLHLRTEGSEKIIGVHHDVNEGVEHAEERRVTA